MYHFKNHADIFSLFNHSRRKVGFTLRVKLARPTPLAVPTHAWFFLLGERETRLVPALKAPNFASKRSSVVGVTLIPSQGRVIHLSTPPPISTAYSLAIARHRDKTPAQVSLNWCITKGTIPIPGAKNIRQVSQEYQATYHSFLAPLPSSLRPSLSLCKLLYWSFLSLPRFRACITSAIDPGLLAVSRCLLDPSPFCSAPALTLHSPNKKIPSLEQADENCGALGWRLSEEEISELDAAASAAGM